MSTDSFPKGTTEEKDYGGGDFGRTDTATTVNTAAQTAPNQAAPIRTISRVPGNPNYYEKNGLRTEGDGQDHSHYDTASVGFIMTVLGCSFALAASQITPLLYLTLATVIAESLHAPNLTIWLLTAGIVGQGSMAPFVGPLADLYGRKTIFLCGLGCGIVGCIVCAVTPTAAGFLAGQVLLGFAAVTEELMAIAVVGESVPTAKRSLYAALILCAIIPWSPGTFYANYMAAASWRWIGMALGLWTFITFILVAVFYFPPPRVNGRGLTKSEKLKRIDFVGGVLLTTGLVLFLDGLNWGGQDYPWTSAQVLSFLIIGACLMISFGLYEFFLAPFPMYPRRIVYAARPFFCMLFVIFAAGINYVALVVFWPIQSISVYDAGLKQNGINTIPIGTCILGGAIVSALLIGLFKKYITFTMTFFCVMQTVAAACLTLIDRNDIRTAWAPLVLALIGTGGVLVPNQIVITVITPDDLIASVTALTVGLRAQAQVIGLAIYYNRLQSQISKNAFKYVVFPIVHAGVFNATLITEFVKGLTSTPYHILAKEIPQLANNATSYAVVHEAVKLAFDESFRLVWYITIAFGVAACIAAAAMGDVSQYMDEHVAVRI